MQVHATIASLRAARDGLSGSVGAVYTMGALHGGHRSLFEQARAENDHVIASIFVNPTQFGPGEDLRKYPRPVERDLAMMEAEGIAHMFMPAASEMYAPGFQTAIAVDEASRGLEGEHRPGHFLGVATVVAKLFNITRPHRAYFGQKDAQQVVVLRRMVADLNFPLEIVVCPTVRDADGLAMSSRNAYLSEEERAAAPVIGRALQAAAAAYEAGEREPAALRDAARTVLVGEPLAQVDYVAVNHPDSLRGALAPTETPLLLSVALLMGTTRLLDNTLLPASLNTRDGLTATLGATGR